MATVETKMLEAKAYWRVSSELRQALRLHAPQPAIDRLTSKMQTYARYGIQPGIRQRADRLLRCVHDAALTG